MIFKIVKLNFLEVEKDSEKLAVMFNFKNSRYVQKRTKRFLKRVLSGFQLFGARVFGLDSASGAAKFPRPGLRAQKTRGSP